MSLNKKRAKVSRDIYTLLDDATHYDAPASAIALKSVDGSRSGAYQWIWDNFDDKTTPVKGMVIKSLRHDQFPDHGLPGSFQEEKKGGFFEDDGLEGRFFKIGKGLGSGLKVGLTTKTAMGSLSAIAVVLVLVFGIQRYKVNAQAQGPNTITQDMEPIPDFDATAELAKTVTLLDANDLDSVIEITTFLIDTLQDGGLPLALSYHQRAAAYDRLGSTDPAVNDLKHALATYHNAPIHNVAESEALLAKCLMLQGNITASLSHISTALRYKPDLSTKRKAFILAVESFILHEIARTNSTSQHQNMLITLYGKPIDPRAKAIESIRAALKMYQKLGNKTYTFDTKVSLAIFLAEDCQIEESRDIGRKLHDSSFVFTFLATDGETERKAKSQYIAYLRLLDFITDTKAGKKTYHESLDTYIYTTSDKVLSRLLEEAKSYQPCP